MENPIKMDDLGVPSFSETSICMAAVFVFEQILDISTDDIGSRQTITLYFSFTFVASCNIATTLMIPQDPSMSKERDLPYDPILGMGFRPSILL